MTLRGRVVHTVDRNAGHWGIAFDLPYAESQRILAAMGEIEVFVTPAQAEGPTEAERGLAFDAQELFGRHRSERETPFPVVCGDEKGWGFGV